jgi:hypothetical protein
MSKLLKLEFVGSQQSKATGWTLRPGFGLIHLSDGKTIYLRESDACENRALAIARERGIDTSEYDQSRAKWEREHSYLPKPESATEYQHSWGFEKPVNLGEWQWSTTFGRWGRIVTFADGWTGYTWPKTW